MRTCLTPKMVAKTAARQSPAKIGRIQQKATKTKRGLYTPSSTQLRVLQRHLDGESQSEISRQEHIDRGTVRVILTKPEVLEMKAACQAELFGLLPLAVAACGRALVSPDIKVAAAAAIKILETTSVLQPNALIVPTQTDAANGLEQAALQIARMTLAKARKYDMELPKDMQRIVDAHTSGETAAKIGVQATETEPAADWSHRDGIRE